MWKRAYFVYSRSDYEKNYNKSQHMVLEINVLMISEELMCKTKRNWKVEKVLEICGSDSSTWPQQTGHVIGKNRDSVSRRNQTQKYRMHQM